MNNYNIEEYKIDSLLASRIVRLHSQLKNDEKLKIIHGAIIEICKKSKTEMFLDKIKNKILGDKI